MAGVPKTGFVYVWYDRARRMFYIGSHWGADDDGYVCSSAWMKSAYARRPQDFKRRIVSRVKTSRRDLFMDEQRWLHMIPESQFGYRYYNLTETAGPRWMADEDRCRTVSEKISASCMGRPVLPETRAKISAAQKGRKRRPNSPEARAKMSIAKTGRPLTLEHRAKISAGNYKRWANHRIAS